MSMNLVTGFSGALAMSPDGTAPVVMDFPAPAMWNKLMVPSVPTTRGTLSIGDTWVRLAHSGEGWGDQAYAAVYIQMLANEEFKHVKADFSYGGNSTSNEIQVSTLVENEGKGTWSLYHRISPDPNPGESSTVTFAAPYYRYRIFVFLTISDYNSNTQEGNWVRVDFSLTT